MATGRVISSAGRALQVSDLHRTPQKQRGRRSVAVWRGLKAMAPRAAKPSQQSVSLVFSSYREGCMPFLGRLERNADCCTRQGDRARDVAWRVHVERRTVREDGPIAVPAVGFLSSPRGTDGVAG